jgi:hypothetical protein
MTISLLNEWMIEDNSRCKALQPLCNEGVTSDLANTPTVLDELEDSASRAWRMANRLIGVTEFSITPPVDGTAIVRVKSDRERLQSVSRYLSECVSQGFLSQSIVDDARSILHKAISKIHAMGRTLPIPDACPGSEGRLLLSWNRESHYIEFEFIPGEHIEVFYRNRLTSTFFDEDFPSQQDIPENVLLYLGFVSRPW